MKNDDALFYACGLIEHIGRTRKQRRKDVANMLGDEKLRNIYRHADVLHSDNMDHVADEYCADAGIGVGRFDNVAACEGQAPERWAIAGVYARLVEDVTPEGAEPIATLQDVCSSWVSDAISDFNSDFYYQPRSYIAACYQTGEQLE